MGGNNSGPTPTQEQITEALLKSPPIDTARNSQETSSLHRLTGEQMEQLTIGADAKNGRSSSATEANYTVTGNFTTPTIDASKYEGREFRDGNFEMPAGLLAAAREEARGLIKTANEQHIDLSKTAAFKGAAEFTKDHKIDQDSLAAFLLAKSMGKNTDGHVGGLSLSGGGSNDHLTATFENKIDTREQERDPKLVFEMARQIMGDNGMGDRIVGGATDTPQADRQFVSENVRRAEHSITAKC